VVHLQSIHIRGFKTFAKPTELVLEPGVTVIIGPNGSGKSNIADAVLWVLGEQSPGNLRGRTMQDVIFSGADGKKQSTVAEVSLVFNNGCGTLPLDCSELEVTRRLTRDSGSDYRLNGSGCRLLDIQDVVGQLGLGREMHSVISQGKVESLLNSSPEFRRAMVEEAAGLGRFKKRRERAQSKLERATQNLVRARDIEEEVRAAMRPLRQQVAAAERHAEATEDWASAKGRLVLHSLCEVEDASSTGQRELERIDQGLSEIGGQIGELRRQRAEEEESFTVALKERERLGAVFYRARAVAEYLESRTAALRQRLARAEGDLDRAKRRLEMARGDSASSTARIAEVMTGTGDEARYERVTAWSEVLRKALEDVLPEYHRAAEEEDDLKDKIFELEAGRSRAAQDRDFLRREKEERGRVGAEVASLVEHAQDRMVELKDEGSRLANAVREAEAALTAAESEVRQASEELRDARTREQEAVQAEAGIAETIAGLESRQEVLRAVLERKEGLPVGVRTLLEREAGYRSLAEVLTVRAGYERAVSAALGSIIQAVVVPPGGSLVQALRESEGAVEVMGEGVDHGEPSAESKAPPGACELWDVVEGPAAVLRTLRSMVPQTFVVDASECEEGGARSFEGEWSETHARVVNLAGELLQGEVYAARRTESGAESLLAAANELDSATMEYEAARLRRAETSEAAEANAAAVQRAQDRLKTCEGSVREAEHQLASLKSESDLCGRRSEETTRQLDELRGREMREAQLADELSEQLKSIDEGMTARESELEESRESLRVLQTSMEGLRRTVARLEEKKSQCSLAEVKLRERCRTLAAERARVQTQKDTADHEVDRWSQRVTSLEGYGPSVAKLLQLAEGLGERSRSLTERLENRVEASRDHTDGSAKTMRDWSSAEIALQREYEDMSGRLTEERVEQARLEDRRVQLEDELAELRRRHMRPRELKREDVAGADPESLVAAVERAERRRDRIGPINPLAEQEYGQMAERAQFLAEQREDLESSVSQLEEVISSLDEHIDRSFNEVFEAAKKNFEAVVSVVFPGAKGSLRLTDVQPRVRAVRDADESVSDESAIDDMSEQDQERQPPKGVDLEVKFANKAPRTLSLLSGGEKAMTAIAFLFALFLAKPCPFYILDEVEAALDDINIRRFLSLIQKYRDRTQFIIITHQRQTMEVADTLYGVALESDGTSRLLSRKMTMAKGA